MRLLFGLLVEPLWCSKCGGWGIIQAPPYPDEKCSFCNHKGRITMTNFSKTKKLEKEEKYCSKCINTRRLYVKPGKFIDCTCVDEDIANACRDYKEIDKLIAKEWRETETNVGEYNG